MALCDYTESRDLLSAVWTNMTWEQPLSAVVIELLFWDQAKGWLPLGRMQKRVPRITWTVRTSELAQEFGSGMGRKNILPYHIQRRFIWPGFLFAISLKN